MCLSQALSPGSSGCLLPELGHFARPWGLWPLPGAHTRVMTFRAPGWHLRIFFFRALEALTRHSSGTGGGGGRAPAGARGGCWGAPPGQAGWPPVPRTPPSVSLPPDSLSPKRLAVWSLAPSSLDSAMVEWNREAHSAERSEPPDSLLAWGSRRGGRGLARVLTDLGPPPLLVAGLGGPGPGPWAQARAEISTEDCHLRCLRRASPPSAEAGAASEGNRAWADAL